MVFPLVCEVYCFRVLHPSFLPKNSAGFLVEGFCWLNHTKNGFPLLKETCTKYKKDPFRAQIETERVSIRERNAQLCV